MTSQPTPDPARAETEAVTRARLAERRRIAQLLHDTVSQSLTGTYLHAMVIARKFRGSGAGEADDVARLTDMLHQVVQEVSAVIRQLEPPSGSAGEPVEGD